MLLTLLVMTFLIARRTPFLVLKAMLLGAILLRSSSSSSFTHSCRIRLQISSIHWTTFLGTRVAGERRGMTQACFLFHSTVATCLQHSMWLYLLRYCSQMNRCSVQIVGFHTDIVCLSSASRFCLSRAKRVCNSILARFLLMICARSILNQKQQLTKSVTTSDGGH